MLRRLRHRLRILKYRRLGVQIADDCRIMGKVSFGSEPYLISIANHVTISGKVTFVTHDDATFVFRHLPQYRHVVKYGRITIHENCFIGNGSLLLPGISIGPNAVVAAHAVVTKDVPPNMVVAGNPARVLMTVEEYAEKMLRQTPAYDTEAYRRDKKAVLLQLHPYPTTFEHGQSVALQPDGVHEQLASRELGSGE